METTRLRTLQQPSIVQSLLESLLLAVNFSPAGATRIAERSELPMALQRIVIKTTKDGGGWAAWLLHDQVSLVTAEMSLDQSRERGHPALSVNSYNGEGRIKTWQIWAQTAAGQWQKHAQ